MDDFNQSFGGPAQQTVIEEAWHTEQRRKQYDIIRVKNPTSEDFYVEYDTNQHQRVVANSTVDIPRYIAIRYVEHMKDKIIHERAQKMHDDVIAERRKKGFPDYKDKATENDETYMTASFPKTNDPDLIKTIFDELWVGVVYEFGRDKPPTNTDQNSSRVDMSSASQKVLEGISNRKVDSSETPLKQFEATPSAPPATYTPPAPPEPTGFAKMSEKLNASEVTQE